MRRKTPTFLAAAGLIASLALAILPGSSPAEAACGTTLPTTKGTVTATVNTPSSATYRVWARILAPSTSVNGFYLQIPDASVCQVTMADAVIPVNTWTWVDYKNGTAASKINAALTAGNHQIQLAGLDTGLEVDKILLLSDVSCTPTGDGSNCAGVVATPVPSATPGSGGTTTPTPTPVVVVIPPAGSSQASKPITVSGTIAVPVPAGVKNATCTVDGKAVDCSKVDTTALSDGKHVIGVSGTDANGKTVERKATIDVKNKLSLQQQLVAGWHKYQPWAIAGIILVLAIPILIFLNYRFGLLHRLLRPTVPLGAGTAPTPPPLVTPGQTVQPQSSDIEPGQDQQNH